MKKSVLFLLIAASPLALASVDSIKNNYRKYALISDSFTNSSDKPGYQVATAPNVNWKPRLNLDNATGSPSIDLSNATGDIGNTGGVNQAVKNHVADEIAKIKPTTPTPPPTPTGWQTIYSGSGTTSISISGSFTLWRAVFSYNDYYGRKLSASPSGVSNGSAILSVSESNPCNSTVASASLNIAIKSSVSFSGQSLKDSVSYGCKNDSDKHVSGSAIAQIINAKITKLPEIWLSQN